LIATATDDPGSAQPPAGFDPTTHRYRWVILAGMWFLYVCFGMTAASLAPLVAPITHDLGISHSAMGAVLGAWSLVYVGAAAACGALTDRFGPRRTLVLAMLVISASGLMRGLAGGPVALFLAVALFGLGGPLVSIGAPKLVSLWFAGRERGLAMGIYVTGASLGIVTSLSAANSVLMPLVNGQWRHVMFVYSGAALFAGCVWLAIGRHWAAREVDRRIAAEPRMRQRDVFAHLVRQPEVRLILAMATCIFFFNHSLNNWLPEILRSGGMDAVRAGFWSATPTTVGILSALLIPRLATPERRFAILAALIVSAGTATVLLHAGSGPLLAVGLVCQGIARGAITTIAVLCLMESREVGARYTGSASGLFFTAGELGAVMGPFTLGALHDATGGFAAGLYLLSGICVLLMGLLFRLQRATRVQPVTPG